MGTKLILLFSASMTNKIFQIKNGHKACFSDSHKLKSGCHCYRCSILASSLFLSLESTCISINYIHLKTFVLTSYRKSQTCESVGSFHYYFTRRCFESSLLQLSDLSWLFQSSGPSRALRIDPFLSSLPCTQSESIQTCHQFQKGLLRPFR